MRVTVVATGIEAEINRRVASRPLRATNVNTQPRQVEETVMSSDSFATRYPEPARVNTATKSEFISAQPTYVETPAVVENQAVASAPQQENIDVNQVEMGTVETEYVTEGNAVRKVEVQQEETQTTSYNSNVIPPHAPAVRDQGAGQGSSLTLNPPTRPMVQNENKKKTPSLFERITGRAQAQEDEIVETETGGSSSAMPSGLTAERKTVATAYDTPTSPNAQGTLNIDAPTIEVKKSATPNADDLDIPAFLRRQIS